MINASYNAFLGTFASDVQCIVQCIRRNLKYAVGVHVHGIDNKLYNFDIEAFYFSPLSRMSSSSYSENWIKLTKYTRGELPSMSRAPCNANSASDVDATSYFDV